MYCLRELVLTDLKETTELLERCDMNEQNIFSVPKCVSRHH